MQMSTVFVALMLVTLLTQNALTEIQDTATRRTLRKLKNRIYVSNRKEIESRAHVVEEENASKFADLRTKCDYKKYKESSWVEYYGNDRDCLETTLETKMTLTSDDSSNFKALCYNPKKALSCDVNLNICVCAKGIRWISEQSLTLEKGECRLGLDADCNDAPWAVCHSSLQCSKKGLDYDGNAVQRCARKTPEEPEETNVKNGSEKNNKSNSANCFRYFTHAYLIIVINLSVISLSYWLIC